MRPFFPALPLAAQRRPLSLAAQRRAMHGAAGLALAVMLGLANPAAAFDPATMTDTGRAAFRAEIRAYLLEHPEVLMEAIGVLEERQYARQAEEDLTLLQDNADALLQDPNSWAGGNPEGDITVVEFIDYRCGYCKRAHAEVEELVGSDGNLRFVLKELPILGEDSVLAARFAVAVLQLMGPEAYKAAHDALMTLRGPLGEAALIAIAGEIGGDAQALRSHMNSPEVNSVLAANQALAQRLGINGTPSFVIHETMVKGYVPLDGMRQIVAGQRERL